MPVGVGEQPLGLTLSECDPRLGGERAHVLGGQGTEHDAVAPVGIEREPLPPVVGERLGS